MVKRMRRSQVLIEQGADPAELQEAERQSMTPAGILLSQEMGKSTVCPNCKTRLHFLLFHTDELVPCHRCEHLVRVP